MDIFKILWALGLIIITLGIISKNRKRQDIAYVVWGILLEIYSISLGDTIFIILEALFTIVAIYDLYTIRRSS